jgi:hypothetical protein
MIRRNCCLSQISWPRTLTSHEALLCAGGRRKRDDGHILLNMRDTIQLTQVDAVAAAVVVAAPAFARQ